MLYAERLPVNPNGLGLGDGFLFPFQNRHIETLYKGEKSQSVIRREVFPSTRIESHYLVFTD